MVKYAYEWMPCRKKLLYPLQDNQQTALSSKMCATSLDGIKIEPKVKLKPSRFKYQFMEQSVYVHVPLRKTGIS
jgi:hypothetical protein